MTRLRFFGVAAYELVTPDGKHILIDPFIDDNPGSPVTSGNLEQVDLILVSHAAYDHLGDTEAIARRTGAPVICGGEVTPRARDADGRFPLPLDEKLFRPLKIFRTFSKIRRNTGNLSRITGAWGEKGFRDRFFFHPFGTTTVRCTFLVSYFIVLFSYRPVRCVVYPCLHAIGIAIPAMHGQCVFLPSVYRLWVGIELICLIRCPANPV